MSSQSLDVSYSWGSGFRAGVADMFSHGFDAHLHVTSWGQRRLAFALPVGALWADEIAPGTLAPPTPAGLGQPGNALTAMAHFLGVDDDLLAATAQHAGDRRDVGDIIRAATQVRENRLAAAAASSRERRRLAALSARGDAAWDDARRAPRDTSFTGYERSLALLRDMRRLAHLDRADAQFTRRLWDLAAEYPTRSTLPSRFEQLLAEPVRAPRLNERDYREALNR